MCSLTVIPSLLVQVGTLSFSHPSFGVRFLFTKFQEREVSTSKVTTHELVALSRRAASEPHPGCFGKASGGGGGGGAPGSTYDEFDVDAEPTE